MHTQSSLSQTPALRPKNGDFYLQYFFSFVIMVIPIKKGHLLKTPQSQSLNKQFLKSSNNLAMLAFSGILRRFLCLFSGNFCRFLPDFSGTFLQILA